MTQKEEGTDDARSQDSGCPPWPPATRERAVPCVQGWCGLWDGSRPDPCLPLVVRATIVHFTVFWSYFVSLIIVRVYRAHGIVSVSVFFSTLSFLLSFPSSPCLGRGLLAWKGWMAADCAHCKKGVLVPCCLQWGRTYFSSQWRRLVGCVYRSRKPKTEVYLYFRYERKIRYTNLYSWTKVPIT